ncbi:hypothetical protein [Streptococcus halotolerans]|nr:hypothetical protein [Streptococcus halotolerans]
MLSVVVTNLLRCLSRALIGLPVAEALVLSALLGTNHYKLLLSE